MCRVRWQENYVFEITPIWRYSLNCHVSRHHVVWSTAELELLGFYYVKNDATRQKYCIFLSDFSRSKTQSRTNSSFFSTGALILPSSRPLAFCICVSMGFALFRILFVTFSADNRGRSWNIRNSFSKDVPRDLPVFRSCSTIHLWCAMLSHYSRHVNKTSRRQNDLQNGFGANSRL